MKHFLDETRAAWLLMIDSDEQRPVASFDKLVAAADKLHNASSLLRDARMLGDSHWARFNASKERQCWYLRSCVEALRDGWSNEIVVTLKQTVENLERLCGIPVGSTG